MRPRESETLNFMGTDTRRHSIVAYAKWKALHPSGSECVQTGQVFATGVAFSMAV